MAQVLSKGAPVNTWARTSDSFPCSGSTSAWAVADVSLAAETCSNRVMIASRVGCWVNGSRWMPLDAEAQGKELIVLPSGKSIDRLPHQRVQAKA